ECGGRKMGGSVGGGREMGRLRATGGTISGHLAGAVGLAVSGAFPRPPAPIPRAPCYPGNAGLCLRCRAPHRPAAGPHETPSPKPSRALGKWLAKDGPRHYPLLGVEVRAARVVMSGPL